MDYHRAPAAAKQQQRQAAITFITRRTPTEAARALLADHRVNDPGDIKFLGEILTRCGRMLPEAWERLIRVATPLMAAEASL